jgi:flavin reductase (DIM6/NTAB) family NADH-FMN oxidoreductase RutF
MNSDAYRDGMSRVATAVHLIATGGPSGLSGCTASAVISVTDNPPTLAVCLNTKSKAAQIIRENGCFSVNTLSAGDAYLSDVFAGRGGISGEDRFAHGEWDMHQPCPRLISSLVSFACRVQDVRTVETHFVIMGVVETVHIGEDRSALVYQNRAYRHTAPLAPTYEVMVA